MSFHDSVITTSAITNAEEEESPVYFDRRDNLVASPVQTYLELMQGDKREQETAEQLRKAILQPLKTKG